MDMNYGIDSGLHEEQLLTEADLPESEPVELDGYHLDENGGIVQTYEDEIAYQEQMEHAQLEAQGEFGPMHHVMVDGGDRYAVSAVAFDGQQELLWMGNQGGHVTSYVGQGMQKYTSFQVHPQHQEVRQLLTIDSRILTLCSDSLRCSTKFGRGKFDYVGEHMYDMQCMLQTGPSTVLLGGHQASMLEIDINTEQELRRIDIDESGCAILKYSNKFVCSGDAAGKVTLRDPLTLKSVHVLKAHSAALSDFDIHGYQLITAGFSNRMGSATADRFLMVYDLRMMRSVAPIQVMMEPMFLRIVPTYSDRICVVSQSGQFQLLEQGAMTAESMIVYQVHTEGAPIAAFDVGPSCNVIAFGDQGGYLHLFANCDDAVFNPYSTPTEFPSMEHAHPISYNDDLTPFSILPMQYPGRGKLLSDWPFPDPVPYRKAYPIDPEILRNTKYAQNIGYAPNPGNRKRNQRPYKVKDKAGKESLERTSSVPDSPLGTDGNPFQKTIPKRYRKVEIKYSKLGVEDFDFRHYNKTNFSGLETHIPNAYCNAMLQVLYFIEPLRCAVLSHLCEREFCLTCELAFLFHMLDTQKGYTCQANNFLRAFRTIPEASALGLLLGEQEETSGKINLARLIQNWNRFILQQIHAEFIETEREKAEMKLNQQRMRESKRFHFSTSPRSIVGSGRSVGDVHVGSPDSTEQFPPFSPLSEPELLSPPLPADADTENPEAVKAAQESIISNMFGTDLVNVFRCRCGEEMKREMKSTLFDLRYPDITAAKAAKTYTFAQIVQQSMALEQNTQAWCNKCNRYQPHVQTKILKCLPDMLVYNCHLENQRDLDFWKAQEEAVRTNATQEEKTGSKTTPTGPKACRYGVQCKRGDCRFWHENDDERKATLKQSEPGQASSAQIDMSAVEDGTEPQWVPLGLKLHLDRESSMLSVENTEDDAFIDSGDRFSYYELLATVSDIRDPRTGQSSLVSQMKVFETYHQRKEKVTCTQWYLFNDFSISPIEKYEACHFNLQWKVPCVFYYIKRDLDILHQSKFENPITSDVLFENTSLVTPRRKHVTFTPLDDEELPGHGDVVGLDAEFVTLNQEEAELRSDGTRSMIKPSQMSVARVTCVRGGVGPLRGEPFIDDYISTQEQVVDYLTQFSGIQPGDLDASISSKHLTTLKCTYRKLRYLVDCGVIFVGHGLKKDFRVINLIMPKDQVIDTVELFQLPRQRMISLKFLAWYFLGVNIQSVMHDSTEDARTALKLYDKYQEMSRRGMDKVREALKELYSKGRDYGWKIPGTETD